MILTLLEEALMLLCIKVYFGNNTDFVVKQGDDVKRYVIKTGWQEANSIMYNNFFTELLLIANNVETNLMEPFKHSLQSFINQIQKIIQKE